MKKEYTAPQVRTQGFQVGAFGSYSDCDDDGGDTNTWSPLQLLAPLFHFCCS